MNANKRRLKKNRFIGVNQPSSADQGDFVGPFQDPARGNVSEPSSIFLAIISCRSWLLPSYRPIPGRYPASPGDVGPSPARKRSPSSSPAETQLHYVICIRGQAHSPHVPPSAHRKPDVAPVRADGGSQRLRPPDTATPRDPTDAPRSRRE